MTVDARISLITLGVADLARSTAFYEALGWPLSSASTDGVSFFDLNGLVLSLYPTSALAADLGLTDKAFGRSASSLAQNQTDSQAVDRVLADAVAAGATLLRPSEKTPWGGYAGYFADPDGHVWEIAHNPFWPLDENGRIVLPR